MLSSLDATRAPITDTGHVWTWNGRRLQCMVFRWLSATIYGSQCI